MGNIEYVNPMFCELTGYSLEEVRGRNPRILQSGETSLETYVECWETALSGKVWHGEFLNKKKNGELYLESVIISPIFDDDGKIINLIGIKNDITMRKHMERELILQKNRLTNILEGSHVGTWEWDIQTGENTINEEWANLLGYTAKEISPVSIDTWRELVYPDDLENAEDLLTKLFDGSLEYFECEIRMHHKNGGWIWILTRGKIVVWAEDGKPLMAAGNHLGITDRKKAEEEIRRQLSEKEIILKEVHHRIKNNFASIGSLLSIQIQEINNPEAISALQDTIGRIDTMKVLYEKLLLTDEYQITSVKNYLEDLIDEILGFSPGSTELTVQKQIIDYQLDLKRLSPIGIIVNELITNIMKYAFTGRDPGIIEVTFEENRGEAVLTIQDNGNGLPEGFDISESTGFGLRLVKMLSEQLGGSFTIENNNGTISTLRFSI